jgi:3-methyl-2-oxobutanoate hydroxymethyltransferase
MRVTSREIRQMKERAEKIPMLTAYDYSFAKAVEEAGVPIILVGDSLGHVVLGYDSTIPVTMDDMLHHTKAVVRGARLAMVVTDLPFLTYHLDEKQALQNAGRCLQEGGAQGVKLEGGASMAPTVRRLTESGIPVMGHLGMTPQSIHQLGGYRVQGKSQEEADRLMADALALEEAGAFSLVLELVPEPLARAVTQRLAIPTIGIGAGPSCDGQVLVLHDMLGLYTDFVPKHAKRYVDLAGIVQGAVAEYVREVQAGEFPTAKESVGMGQDGR